MYESVHIAVKMYINYSFFYIYYYDTQISTVTSNANLKLQCETYQSPF